MSSKSSGNPARVAWSIVASLVARFAVLGLLLQQQQ